MRAALPTSATFIASFTPKKVLLTPRRKHLLHHSCSILSESRRRWFSIGCSLETPAAEHFGEQAKVVSYLNNLADSLWGASPEPLKEFPWKQARSIFAQRLLILGRKAVKWSLIVLFATSVVSDVSMAVSRNQELMIPLGLSTGAILADFLKESSQEFFQNSIKDGNSARLLLGIGSFMVMIKFLALCFKVKGRILLSHIGNGGLMLVLWLANELQRMAKVEMQEGQILDASNSITSEG